MSNSAAPYQISKAKAYGFCLLVVVLVATNVLLIRQNSQLKAEAGKGDRSLEVKPGKQLPAFDGRDVDGNQLTIAYGQDPRKTLLFVLSPRCGLCRDIMPDWEKMVKSIDQKSFRVVAVSLTPEGTKEFLAKYNLGSIPVIADADPKDRVDYEMTLTPQTVLIGSDGKVEKVWTGLLTDEEEEIERSLGVALLAQRQ